MGVYNHLMLGIPYRDLPALAASLGLTWAWPSNPDQATAEDSWAMEPMIGQLASRLGAPLPRKAWGAAAGNDADGGLAHLEWSEGRPLLFGFTLYSTYTDKGLAEARAAEYEGGYLMTPELISAAQIIRSTVSAGVPAFANAVLAVVPVSW